MKFLHKKRILLFSLGVLLVAAGCGGGGGGGGGATTTKVQGTILARATGAGLAGVTVSVGTATTASIADGSYSLAVTPGADLVVKALRTGYVPTLDVVTAAAGQTLTVDFALNLVGGSNALADMTVENTATDPRNTQVILPPNSVVGADGVLVAAAIVDITTALPSDANYTETFPGLFVGVMNDTETAIESFGFVTVDITSGGAKCNLATGSTAEIVFPIDPNADPGTATIELWSLNETTGLWAHEGDAVRDDSVSPNVYRATVSHFSTYNLDRPIDSDRSCVVTVTNNDVPVAGAAVTVVSTDSTRGSWEGRGVTGAGGVCNFDVVPAGSVRVTATYGSLAGSGYGYEDDGNVITMTVPLCRSVTRTFTVVRDVGGVQQPVAGVSVEVMAEGGSGDFFAQGTTGDDGTVTLQVQEGLDFYNVYAAATIEGQGYAASADTTSSVDALPATLVLTLNLYQ